ncbi:hypothetical protein CsSME_00017471 [Camellia sinensis var. sinensis]
MEVSSEVSLRRSAPSFANRESDSSRSLQSLHFH